MKKIPLTILAAGILSVASATPAYAYLTPEEVLFSQDLYLPPTRREVDSRTARQQELSTARREAAQAPLYATEEPETLHGSAPEPTTGASSDAELSGFDLELLRTIRLLDRVESANDTEILHGGAPLADLTGKGKGIIPGKGGPLAPTGAPAIISALAMLGAAGWTLRRAGKSEGFVKREL